MVKNKIDAISELIGKKQSTMDDRISAMFDQAEINEEVEDVEYVVVNDPALDYTNLDDPDTNTAPKQIADVQTMWEDMNRELIIQAKADGKLKELKVACSRCLRTEFDSLEEAPAFEEYRSMNFVTEDKANKIITEHEQRKRIVLGTNYMFKCPVCQGGHTFYVETV